MLSGFKSCRENSAVYTTSPTWTASVTSEFDCTSITVADWSARRANTSKRISSVSPASGHDWSALLDVTNSGRFDGGQTGDAIQRYSRRSHDPGRRFPLKSCLLIRVFCRDVFVFSTVERALQEH